MRNAGYDSVAPTSGSTYLVIFTEYISVEAYNQTPKNKLEKYLISIWRYRVEK
jgi:hypothetical protein